MANAKLGSKAVGSIVKLKVGGMAKEFIVVHQGKPSSFYDDSCNGTWLLMKDIYDLEKWNSTEGQSNNYAESAVHSYLNGELFNLFDGKVKSVIKSVNIPYDHSIGTSADNLVSAKLFLLSGYEVGFMSTSDTSLPYDGDKLSYFEETMSNSGKRVANFNGEPSPWWTRSKERWADDSAIAVSTEGGLGEYNSSTNYLVGIRPALILPFNVLVDDSGNVVILDLTAHKTLINGTAYTVQGGKCMVNGTVYSIKKGRTLIGGTGYDITFAPPLVMPVKGDLITMNLDGTERQYRILSVNRNVCKVLGMWDDFTSKYNNTSTTTIFRSTRAQKYEGSTLDMYLNTTWYNTLSSEAKNAIVPENVVQYCYKYYDAPNTPNTPTYTYQYQYNWSDSDYENADNVGNVVVGNRNVFALDLKDIFDYIGKVCITSDELMTMFWNSTTKVSKYLWLRSSLARGSNYAWAVYGYAGGLDRYDVTYSFVVRPALNLDMSKIQYTLV